MDSNSLVKSHPLTASLLNDRRQKEEDAKCNICGSGDYEENDLIVFCGFCGIAVHQSCYGVEEIPDGEWFCISCYLFGKKKGRNLKCVLCSKSGGAMRPTNILNSDEFLVKYRASMNGKDKIVGPLPNRIFKSEKKNATLAFILNQEHTTFINTTPTTLSQPSADQEDFYAYYENLDTNLNYKLEKEHLYTPKYAWAHLSCANFILEIEYTPKSPLKLGKLIGDRFLKPCIIC